MEQYLFFIFKTTPSLQYLDTRFLSLQKPHPILTSAGRNVYEIRKAVIQVRMLSGRYRSELLCSHWSGNKDGYCRASECVRQPEDLEHILLHCPSLSETRLRLVRFWVDSTENNPVTFSIIQFALSSDSHKLAQFILDCSTMPFIIESVQLFAPKILDKLLHLTRTWCYAVHRDRLKNQGRWNFHQLVQALGGFQGVRVCQLK